MTLDEVLLVDNFQEVDARTVERRHLNEFLDKDNPAEALNIV